ncbi:MAG: radical SAM family RiPP maturation amino acid epimerase [bacterium]|nr:radical SAM family RiPP maturation amino acid epimerase [bacterium]
MEKESMLKKDKLTIGEMKRFLEVWCGDGSFRDMVAKDPYKAIESFGITTDPEVIRQLWDNDFAAKHPEPLNESVRKYREFNKEKVIWRGTVRDGCEPKNTRFKEWRKREMERGLSQFGPVMHDKLIYTPLCIELSSGCSVGCRFCAFNARPLTGNFLYTKENARLWQDILHILKDIVGPAARWGTCYYATEPFDNPDYEKFCTDFSDVLEMFPQTTSAIPMKNPERTRKLLELSQSRGCRVDRFSILTLKVLQRVHKAFTADQLINVELIVQNKESILTKAVSGRFLTEVANNSKMAKQELKKIFKEDNAGMERASELPGTVSCLAGFMVNMVDKTIKLVSPCNADEKWPLGYIVYDQGTFTDAESFRNLMQKIIRDSMPLSAGEMDTLRFRRGTTYKRVPDGFEVKDKFRQINVKNENISGLIRNTGDYIREGNKTAKQIALLSFYKYTLPEETTMGIIDTCLKHGVLDHEPPL